MEILISSPFFCSRSFSLYFLSKKEREREEEEKKENLMKGSGKDETRNHFAGGGVVVKSVINELWHGNVIPQEDSRTNSPEMKELLSYMARHHEELEKSFSDEQKTTFEKFHDCWSEYVSLAEAAIFSYAFKLGAQIMLETLNARDTE